MSFNFLKLIILVLASSLSLILAITVFQSNKKSKLNKLFLALSMTTFFWLLFAYLSSIAVNLNNALIWSRLNFGVVSLCMIFAYFFVRSYPEDKINKNIIDIFYIILGFVLFVLSVFTDKIILSVNSQQWGNLIQYGVFWTYYVVSISIIGMYSVGLLIKKYFSLSEEGKKRTKYFIIGVVLFFIGNLIFNTIINLVTDSNKYDFLGDYSAIFFLGFTAFAIVRHGLFNIKIIATETTVVALSLALFVEIFISNTTSEGVVKGIIWLLASYGGFVLVKSVKKEIEQREQIQELAKDLKKANEELKELDEQKDNFISMASHELNTPIAAIVGYLSMIIDEKMVGEINPKAMGYLQNIYGSSKRLSALVKDLLNVSRIESGRIHIVYTEAQIEEVIDQSIAEVAIKAKEVGHTLTFEKPRPPLPKTYFDIPRITEVIINIIGNAIKYTDPPGKIVVKAHTDHDKIVVSVEDNGRGIPKNKEKDVFAKFNQVNVLKDQVKGTGLGMFISKNLIELHGGKIWFKSSVAEEDHGTTFYFSVPVLKTKPHDEHEGEGAVLRLK